MVGLEQEDRNWTESLQVKWWCQLRMAVDRCSMIVQRTYFTMSARANDCQEFASTLQGP
jgi:hypothetical protein